MRAEETILLSVGRVKRKRKPGRIEMTIKFIKRGEQWALASDTYLREGDLVDVQTSKGVKAVRVGKQLEKPQGVQRRGSYVYQAK